MAYKVRKSSHITEDIELIGEKGEVEKVISVDINVDRIMSGYRQAEINLIKLQKSVKNKENSQALESYGKAVVDYFNMVFGTENTKEMLEFFEGRYTDMFCQLMPFITEIVKPALAQAIAAKKSDIANNYSFSRKQKRKLGLK